MQDSAIKKRLEVVIEGVNRIMDHQVIYFSEDVAVAGIHNCLLEDLACPYYEFPFRSVKHAVKVVRRDDALVKNLVFSGCFLANSAASYDSSNEAFLVIELVFRVFFL